MRVKLFKLLGIFVLAIAGLAPAALLTLSARMEAGDATIHVGNRDSRGNRTGFLTIRNTGLGLLKFKQVHTSCGCLDVNVSHSTVLPFGETQIRVTATPKDGQGRISESLILDNSDAKIGPLLIKVIGDKIERTGFAVAEMTTSIDRKLESHSRIPLVGLDAEPEATGVSVVTNSPDLAVQICRENGESFVKLEPQRPNLSGIVKMELTLLDRQGGELDRCEVTVILRGGITARPGFLLIDGANAIEFFSDEQTDQKMERVTFDQGDLPRYLRATTEGESRVRLSLTRRPESDLRGNLRFYIGSEEVIVPIVLLAGGR